MWGIHNDRPRVDFLDGGLVALGWSRLADLRDLPGDRDGLKAALRAAYPEAKAGAIPVWAGMLLRFVHEMAPGDLVVHPCKLDATVNLGRVEGDYYWDAAAPEHRHRRPVAWEHTGLPRALFSAGALRELGSAVTLFRIRHHVEEFALSAGPSPPGPAARSPRPPP
jgi:restriction system protein